MGGHTATVGFYKMPARTFRCVDVKCAIGVGLKPILWFVEPTPKWGLSLQNGVSLVDSFNLTPKINTNIPRQNGSIPTHLARDGLYKMAAGKFPDQQFPIWPQKKSSIKWNWVLRRGTIYKMGSTKRGGSTPPTLTKRWISIWFCSRPHPFCRGNRKGMHNSAGWPGLDKFSRVQANKGMQPKRAKGSTGRLR